MSPSRALHTCASVGRCEASRVFSTLVRPRAAHLPFMPARMRILCTSIMHTRVLTHRSAAVHTACRDVRLRGAQGGSSSYVPARQGAGKAAARSDAMGASARAHMIHPSPSVYLARVGPSLMQAGAHLRLDLLSGSCFGLLRLRPCRREGAWTFRRWAQIRGSAIRIVWHGCGVCCCASLC